METLIRNGLTHLNQASQKKKQCSAIASRDSTDTLRLPNNRTKQSDIHMQKLHIFVYVLAYTHAFARASGHSGFHCLRLSRGQMISQTAKKLQHNNNLFERLHLMEDHKKIRPTEKVSSEAH